MTAAVSIGTKPADEEPDSAAPDDPPPDGKPPAAGRMPRATVAICGAFNAIVFLAPMVWLVWRSGSGALFWSDEGGGASGALRAIPCVAAIGASMGALHSLASLGVRAGRRKLQASWMVYYLVRPLTGAGVAIVTSLVLMSGIGGFNVTAPLAQLGWAALAGLYSEQALSKLRDVFTALLQPSADTKEPPPAKGATALVAVASDTPIAARPLRPDVAAPPPRS